MCDLTERKQLEEHLIQAHKMENVGKLAGDVAHDFSNLLPAILGFVQLADNQLVLDETVNGNYIRQISTATERGPGLIRQLWAFCRR